VGFEMKNDFACMTKPKSQRGMVLVVCLIVLLMISLIGIASIMTSNTDMTIAGNEMNQTGSFYAAESGLEEAAAAIISSYRTTGNPPSPLPSGEQTLGAFEYSYSVADQGPAVNTTLTDGAYKGLYGLVKTFDISSTGFDYGRESAVLLNMGLQDALIPIYQFAVFYEYDLEIAPGPDMTLGGRVHSNGNVYLQSDNNLYIDSYLTSSGDITHGRKPGSGQSNSSGNVFIRDSDGNYQNMKNADGTFLDSTDPDWTNSSLSRWGGNVEDRNHGITELYMPVVSQIPSTNLIDRAAGNSDSYEHKAGLKFVDGQALYRQADGAWLDVTSSLITSGVISAGNFHDGREGVDVYSLDIDIGALASSGYYPSNGIIYASQPQSQGCVTGVRLKNGSDLPSGLTVATDNPMYTLGDFNTINKQPASLMADAITILSNNWDDANSWQRLRNRSATATQVNACYMTGNTETGSSGHGYNGGLENLPRFLESWSGVTFAWRGSAIDVWYSRQATGAWSYGSYYEAPYRDWAFDPDLLDPAKLPPGTPLVSIVQRMSWRQTIVSDY
jgi:hypothetical protein